MKSKILTILVFSILSSEFFSCSSGTSSDNPIQLIALAARAARVIADSRNNVVLQGTVNGPGAIQNATVQVYPTPTNGQCAKDDGTINGTPIASTTSDEFGNYSLKYKKTGSTVCVVVTPTGTSQIQVFSPATRTNIPTSWSKGNLMAVINEPATSNAGFTAGNKTVNVNPFTRMTARRFSALSAINPPTRRRFFFRVIPAAERSAYSLRGGASNNDKVEFRNNTASNILDKASDDVENAFFPNRDKATFSLESADPNSNTMKLRLGTIGLKADKLGGSADGKVSSDDLEKVVNFMEEDFSDGRFDGKKVDDSTGKIATMTADDFGGVVASKQAADDFLKVAFKAAQSEYDSYDPSLTSSASDELFCETDSLDAACSITVLPGSPPDIWLFDQNEDFLDIGDSFDHGSVGSGVGGTSSTRYYTIVNGGGSDLKLTLPFTLTGTQFTVVEQPDAVVAAGDATYFAVKFVPSAASSFTQTLTIISNDTLYSPYIISVLGTGVNLNTNLRIYWPFTGNTNDLSGFNRHGTLQGSPLPELWYDYFAEFGKAYYFDAYNNNSITNAYGTNLGTAITVSAWLSPDDLTNCPCTIIARDGLDFSLSYYDETTIEFMVDTGTPEYLYYYVDNDFDYDDGWIHVVGVYSSASGKMQIYINGELQDETPYSGTLISGSTTFYAGDDGTGNYFTGTLDDIRLYAGALTAAQVEALYNQD